MTFDLVALKRLQALEKAMDEEQTPEADEAYMLALCDAAPDLVLLAQRALQSGTRTTTHSAVCWHWHLDCAVAKIERMEGVA